MLLKEIVEKGHYDFLPAAADWRDAIVKSCAPLVRTGHVTEAYAQQVIATVEELGPYIVIVPGLAIPHSIKGAPGVSRTAMSFVRFAEPVVFDEDDRDKDATVFFALAALDPDEHLANMRQLFKILSSEELLAELKTAQSAEDLLALEEKYLAPK